MNHYNDSSDRCHIQVLKHESKWEDRFKSHPSKMQIIAYPPKLTNGFRYFSLKQRLFSLPALQPLHLVIWNYLAAHAHFKAHFLALMYQKFKLSKITRRHFFQWMRHQSMADLWVSKTMITAVFSLNFSTKVEFLMPLPLPLLYHFDWHSDLEFCMNLWCVFFLLILICVDCRLYIWCRSRKQNTKRNNNCLVSYAICVCVSACGVFLHCGLQNTIYKLAYGSH